MAGSTTESLDRDFSYRKNHICSPHRRTKHSKQSSCPLLLAEKHRVALCHFLGRGREGTQPGALSTEYVSINYNSNFSLWKLTLNWQQHSFASGTQFIQANLAILAVSLFLLHI